jgi:hypothetical protein
MYVHLYVGSKWTDCSRKLCCKSWYCSIKFNYTLYKNPGFWLVNSTWQLLNTIGCFELFPSAGTVVVFRFVLLDSGWSIPNEFGGLRHVRVKKWNTFSQIPRQNMIYLFKLPNVDHGHHEKWMNQLEIFNKRSNNVR